MCGLEGDLYCWASWLHGKATAVSREGKERKKRSMFLKILVSTSEQRTDKQKVGNAWVTLAIRLSCYSRPHCRHIVIFCNTLYHPLIPR